MQFNIIEYSLYSSTFTQVSYSWLRTTASLKKWARKENNTQSVVLHSAELRKVNAIYYVDIAE